MDSPKASEDIKESSRSDISAFTDMKVFQGYLGSNDLFKRLNEDQCAKKRDNSHSNSKANQQQQQEYKMKKNMQQANTTACLSKLNEYKDEHSNCNYNCNSDQSPELFLLKSLPLETPTSTKGHLDFISFGNGNELTTGKQSSPIGNMNEEDTRSNNSKQSRKSRKSNMSLNDPQNEESNTNSGNNNPMKAFITTLNDEEDTGFNSEDIDNSKQNIFWKQRHQNDDLSTTNVSDKNKEDFQLQPMKTMKKVVDSFTIAKIEKGIALLVSSDDCIFTLPTFLLPYGAKIGNTYSLSIDESCSLFESEINLQSMQKRLLNKPKTKE